MNCENQSVLILQKNNFDHCDNMSDVWIDSTILVKPHKWVYCPILKNMNTQIRALIAKVYYKQNISRLDIGDYLSNVWGFMDSFISNEQVIPRIMRKKFYNLKYSSRVELFSVIRHPFDRFVSIFSHLCAMTKECTSEVFNFCENDLDCMLDYLQKIGEECKWNEIGSSSLAMLHFAPQSYFCFFRKLLPYYVMILYSNTKLFQDTLMKFFINRGAPTSVISQGWGETKGPWLKSHTAHSTNVKFSHLRHRIMSNITILDRICRIYKADFRLFTFSMPDIVLHHCQNNTRLASSFCVCRVYHEKLD